MSHLVENMFYVGETPWHGLGKQLDKAPTSEDAIVQAGLDWKVNLEPISVGGLTFNNFLALQRETDGEVYGVVKPGYTPLQNKDAFAFFDPIVKAGLAEYHTAGALQKGSRVWILAKLAGDDMTVANGDIVERFLLLSNGHNGRNGVNIQFTPVRVVCNNTLTMAESQDTPSVSIMHSRKVVRSLEEVRQIVDVANQTFDATLDQYRKLADMGVKNVERYITKVFYPKVNVDALDNDELTTTVDKVIHLFKNDATNNLPSISGSLWSAYNAVTQYVDHFRGRDDTRLNQAWFGQGKLIKQRALSDALELAA